MCRPQFTQVLRDMSISDGDQLQLQATVAGDPEPQILWTRNGNPIASSEIMDLKYKNGCATLTIAEVFPEDEGQYTCTATNSIGSTDTSCRLTITGLLTFFFFLFL